MTKTPDEYISREAALKYIKSAQCRRCSDIGLCGNCAVLVAVKLLEKVPAADVAPVRHGRWIFGKDLPYSWGQIPKNKYHLYCPECLEQAFNRSEDNDPDFDVDASYCPNCGAKMDGGNDDATD